MLIATINEHGDEVHEIAISPNGKYFATADSLKCLIIWQLDIDEANVSVKLV